MATLRPTRRIARESAERLVIQTHPLRRFGFGLIGLLLAITFALNFDPSVDLSRDSVVMTILFALATVACLLVAITTFQIVIDRERGIISRRYCFGGTWLSGLLGAGDTLVVLATADTDLEDVRTVRLRDTSPVAGREANPRAPRSQELLSRRTRFSALTLETNTGQIRIDSSSEAGELTPAAQRIAEFIGVPVENDDPAAEDGAATE